MQNINKVCTGCGHQKPLTDFHRTGRGDTKRRSKCKSCVHIQVRDQRRAKYATDEDFRARVKATTAKNRYNFESIDDYLLFMADKVCEVCGTTEKLSIDHDHRCCPGPKTCGECLVGVLCINCNLAEGHIKDSDRALKLAEYLRKKESGRRVMVQSRT